ncbi:MAG: ABC transporter ATP-binding protein [Oscillospiraceae bacterium]|nr:ABC transporter ATP-binding protein [Oscillospiraceae bacterium]
MSNVIEISGLNKKFGSGENEALIFDGAELQIEKGSFVSLTGASGSGKSTLLYLIGGLDRDYTGNISVGGKSIAGMNDRQLSAMRSEKLSYVFQFYNLVANLTVEENILLPIELSGKKVKNYREKLREILEMTGLSEKRRNYPSQLSGGQQQRCSIARAVLSEPEILLADEPTGNLDKAAGEEIMKLFKRLNEENGITVLQVTHSDACAAYGSRIVRLSDHRLEDVGGSKLSSLN